ncbi:hypothetical protein [Microbacterium sulfonylureivorans]|uniref:hypothetical protein n=1 Tax=Microbacterium sulfonylureivorans TaxID=2486854 RepID=UPI000FD9D862|nr:hypothetical protein [Microbacterium sulfonylureivorans]
MNHPSPTRALREQGIACAFGHTESLVSNDDDTLEYRYRIAFAGPAAMVALAHLVADGWDVTIRPRDDALSIRLHRGLKK